MFRIGGGTEYPLELHDCRLPASIDMFNISTAPESVESLHWLALIWFGLFDWLSDWLHPWLDRSDGVDEAFWRFDQLFGEYKRPSLGWSGSLLTRGDSIGTGFSISIFFWMKFESRICSFCTDVPGCGICNGCGWIWCVCCCGFKFFSEPSNSRRRAISFLISFRRSRSAAKVTRSKNERKNDPEKLQLENWKLKSEKKIFLF